MSDLELEVLKELIREIVVACRPHPHDYPVVKNPPYSDEDWEYWWEHTGKRIVESRQYKNLFRGEPSEAEGEADRLADRLIDWMSE